MRFQNPTDSLVLFNIYCAVFFRTYLFSQNRLDFKEKKKRLTIQSCIWANCYLNIQIKPLVVEVIVLYQSHHSLHNKS